jgi:nucleoside-diphosphate-sugar epimerase
VSEPRILITGGAGYFGSLLDAKLREQGEACRLFDMIEPEESPDGSPFVRGDVPPSGQPAKASTWSITASPRFRWRATASCSRA